MKALIRNEGETVTEDMEISGIDWTSGAPLTNGDWHGGSYILVNNYTTPVEDSESCTITEEPQDDSEDTVVINGVTYTKAELRALLGDE